MNKMSFTVGQAAAISRLQGNTAVAAGAGSGKTRVLVERYLHIVEQGLTDSGAAGVSGIVAITFTKKAAGELRERVRRELALRAEWDAANASFWQRQLEELPKAQISTIHGYCSRLLREHPVELALDPNFKVAEEFEAEEFLQECLHRFLGLRFGSGGAVTELSKQYGGQAVLQQLQLLLPKVEDIAGTKNLAAPYEAGIAQAQMWYLRLADIAEELARSRTELATKSNQDFFDRLEAALPDITGALREQRDTSVFDSVFQGMAARGKIASYIKEIKDLRGRLDAAAADRQALPLVHLWQDALQDFAAFIRQEKERRDFLSFDDLETLALELLQQHPEVCRICRERVKYLMVDEFQDTNERQKQIIYLLCGGDAQQLQGRKLFVVGDPKQSIYRFRGADVSVFAGVRRAVQEQDAAGVITMYDNFRTADRILQAVDIAFSQLMGTDKQQDVFFEPLLPHITGGDKPVFLLAAYDKESSGNKRLLEAEAVAREIEALHARAGCCRDDAGQQLSKKLQYKDMAILLGRFTHVQALTEALRRHNIPFVVKNGKGFYDCQEVLDLLNLFKALHNKHNNIELAGALRSPYFGLDDESLTRLFLDVEKNASLLDALADALQDAELAKFSASQQPLLRRAQQILSELRRAACVCGLPELWQAADLKLNFAAVLSRQKDGAQKVANMRKLRQLMLGFAAEKSGSLGEWLAHTAKLRSQASKETAANLTADDAVTIMTIHGSKGLEFKAVLLPMLDTAGKSDSDMIRFDKTIGLGVKAVMPDGSLQESSVFKAVKEQDKALEAAERLRLLYVAMTRAQYYLVLSGAYNQDNKESKAESWFSQLHRVYDGKDAVEFKEVDLRHAELAGVQQQEDEPVPAPPELLAAAEPLQEFNEGMKTFAPSSLQEYLYCQRLFFYRYAAQLPELFDEVQTACGADTEDGGRFMPPKLRGTVVHRALELLHWEKLPPEKRQERQKQAADVWQTALLKEAPEYAGSAAAEAARQLFFAYINGDLYNSIAPAHERELQFCWLHKGYEFRGVLDCLYRDKDGCWHVVDYKTGRAPQNLKDKGQLLGYDCQLALYRQAMREIYKAQDVAAELHFLADNSSRPLPENEDFLQQALAVCDEISGKGYEENAFACTDECQRCLSCGYKYLCPR